MKQSNVAGHLVVWAFLLTVLFPMNAMSNSLWKELDKNTDNVTLQPHELFARRYVGGASSNFEFVNNTVDIEQGICNMDKAKLSTNEMFIFNEITIGYTQQSLSSPGECSYLAAMPAGLRNAEFEIRQGGRLVLNIPVASLNNHYIGTSTGVQDDFTALGSLCYLKDDEDFTWSFKFPTGVSLAAGTTGNADYKYAEVRLRGHRTIRKR